MNIEDDSMFNAALFQQVIYLATHFECAPSGDLYQPDPFPSDLNNHATLALADARCLVLKQPSCMDFHVHTPGYECEYDNTLELDDATQDVILGLAPIDIIIKQNESCMIAQGERL